MFSRKKELPKREGLLRLSCQTYYSNKKLGPIIEVYEKPWKEDNYRYCGMVKLNNDSTIYSEEFTTLGEATTNCYIKSMEYVGQDWQTN